MLGACLNFNYQTHVVGCLPNWQEESFAELGSPEQLRHFFFRKSSDAHNIDSDRFMHIVTT